MKLMSWKSGLTFLVCAVCLYAQVPEEPEVIRAKADIARLRSLVDAGAAPRMQLEKAEAQLADAEDSAYLRKTLYGQDLTAEQADDMIAAATRRFERRKQAFDEAKKLVDLGVAAATTLEAPLADMDMSRKEADLADSRAKLTRELAEMARVEESLESRIAQQPADAHAIAERFDGDGVFTTVTFSRVETAFEKHFGKTLPISANGETAVHKALGFDHRGRVDVALQPDTAEGVWLRDYLTGHKIPYFAFRQAVPGKATGAHIHLGPMSTRIKNGG
jgi:hypothetical protein